VIMLSVVCNWKQSPETENADLVAEWQPHVDPETVKEYEWTDTDTNLPPGQL
jgi:hypothetical protein